MTAFSRDRSNSTPRIVLLFALGAGLAFSGCGHKAGPLDETSVRASSVPDPLAIALVPHAGESPLDERIRRSQEQVRAAKNTPVNLEQLGWLFVAKARASFDNGFYKLAEQCALCMESHDATNASALLLHGHVLHNLHKFKEA